MKREHWIYAGIATLALAFNLLNWKPLEYLAYAAFGLYAVRGVFKSAD